MQIAVSISGSKEKFASLMNQKAKDLKLKDTNFTTPHGLDEEEHYTTAYELAIIADYALRIEKISEIVKTKTYSVMINKRSKTINNTNELLGYLEGVNGVKTGFTNGAGRCLVTSVSRDGFNIITVVLGADTKKIRTSDSIKLIEYIYSNYELVNLEELVNQEFNNWSNINKKRIYINKGKKTNIEIGINSYKYKECPIKKEDIKNIKIKIQNIDMYFEAPTYKGTKIAILKTSVKDKEIMNIDIVTKEEVKRKEVKDYLKEYLNVIAKGGKQGKKLNYRKCN